MNQGYEHSRFEITVNKNFHCPICMNVLKDPVQCQRNQHYFCTPCITKHLNNNSLTCPICMDRLTLETLGRPARIVVDYLSSLKISCDYAERGCSEVMELGVLDTHVADCGYSTVICSNEKCTTVVHKRDQEHHETEVCEFRIVQCHDCNDEMSHKRYVKHGCLLNKEVEKIKLDLLEMKDQFGKIRSAQEEMFKEMRDMMAEIKVTNNTVQSSRFPARSDARGDIVVLGGRNTACSLLNSVEMFSWSNRGWTPLPPMQLCRASATSFCYGDQIIVAGGLTNNGIANTMERIRLDQKPEKWVNFPVNLPYKCKAHKSLIYDHRLLVVGGRTTLMATSSIHEVLLKPPYTSKFRTHMPQSISYHGLERFDDKILIFGGTTSGFPKNNVDTALSYDVNNNECKEIALLPFPMCDMATVRWEDDVIIIGGTNTNHKSLNTVFMYNYKTKECKTLPSMNYKRAESAAVISGNGIVVMGGYDEVQGPLNSVEYFNFDGYYWEELTPMQKRRYKTTAVVKPVNSV